MLVTFSMSFLHTVMSSNVWSFFLFITTFNWDSASYTRYLTLGEHLNSSLYDRNILVNILSSSGIPIQLRWFLTWFTRSLKCLVARNIKSILRPRPLISSMNCCWFTYSSFRLGLILSTSIRPKHVSDVDKTCCISWYAQSLCHVHLSNGWYLSCAQCQPFWFWWQFCYQTQSVE